MKRLSIKSIFLLFVTLFAINNAFPSEIFFNVRDYHATGDGKTLDTKAIQNAIEKCYEAGGGSVYFPPGKYLTGTLFLKSNVALYIEAGAVMLGINRMEDYTNKAIIYARNENNIAILGRGAINGQGGLPPFLSDNPFSGNPDRPYLVHFVECNRIKIKDITLQDGAAWGFHCKECDNILIDGIEIHSMVNANNDGFDLVDCSKVRVANSIFNTGDDAICLKSNATNKGCHQIAITNCNIRSEAYAIKTGTASYGDFTDITISNCTIYDTRLSGIALLAVDGGSIERVCISNITMVNVNGSIFMRLGKRHTEKPGRIRNIIISNVQAHGIGTWRADTTATYFKPEFDARIGTIITGIPNHPIENVTLENIRFHYEGGGTVDDSKLELKELIEEYPTYCRFGVTPVYGFYCRHIDDIKFNHIQLEFEKQDERPAFLFDDVQNIDLTDIEAEISENAISAIRFCNCQDIFLDASQLQHKLTNWISLEGESNKNIKILNSDSCREIK